MSVLNPNEGNIKKIVGVINFYVNLIINSLSSISGDISAIGDDIKTAQDDIAVLQSITLHTIEGASFVQDGGTGNYIATVTIAGVVAEDTAAEVMTSTGLTVAAGAGIVTVDGGAAPVSDPVFIGIKITKA